jgi:phosphoribulokinase
LIGTINNVNLEWIRKIQRDTVERGYTAKQVRKSILRRMPDYVEYITPQFSRTHINFQTISTIDTSDPFNQARAPNQEECYIVIHDQKNVIQDIASLSRDIPDSFISRPSTIVIPGGMLMMALETIFTPLIRKMVERGRKLRGDAPYPASFRGSLQGLI